MSTSPPRRWLALVPLVLLAALAGTQPPALPAASAPGTAPAAWATSQPGRLTVAALNVEWMLDVFDDPYSKDEIQPPKPRPELESLARLLRRLDADVVALEELENEGLLKAFVAGFLPDMGYRYVAVQATNSEHGQNLGLLSRLPIQSITSHRFADLTLPEAPGKSWRFARDAMVTALAAPGGQTLEVMVLHLKSKRGRPDADADQWRQAEAAFVREWARGRHRAAPQGWWLVAGDLNDTPGSATLERLLAAGAPGGPGATAPLWDVHRALPAGQRVTYLKAPYRSTIDYLLASPALDRRLVAGTARVVADTDLRGGTDHAPVVATFDLAPE